MWSQPPRDPGPDLILRLIYSQKTVVRESFPFIYERELSDMEQPFPSSFPAPGFVGNSGRDPQDPIIVVYAFPGRLGGSNSSLVIIEIAKH